MNVDDNSFARAVVDEDEGRYRVLDVPATRLSMRIWSACKLPAAFSAILFIMVMAVAASPRVLWLVLGLFLFTSTANYLNRNIVAG
jgi:hypothetical protein